MKEFTFGCKTTDVHSTGPVAVMASGTGHGAAFCRAEIPSDGSEGTPNCSCPGCSSSLRRLWQLQLWCECDLAGKETIHDYVTLRLFA
ncbi:hypothetical protein AVEN_139656-1 [Araneus ventricosus]|uniref:Uncharacterized protein n=1 Tax=Araneus ventricosus TaxID=182803 RepID=A0A4Y2FWP7_ARAVE|nr:hypothetical protein AVEN_139656-1 [Araneus ventricosus]